MGAADKNEKGEERQKTRLLLAPARTSPLHGSAGAGVTGAGGRKDRFGSGWKSAQWGAVGLGALLLAFTPLGFLLAACALVLGMPVLMPGVLQKVEAEYTEWRSKSTAVPARGGQNTSGMRWAAVVAVVCTVLSAASVAITVDLPADDMLRHAVAWQWGYDNRLHYPHSLFSEFAWSQWIGWEWLCGQFAQGLGLTTTQTIGVMRGVLTLVTGLLVYKVVERVFLGDGQGNPVLPPVSHAQKRILQALALLAFALIFYGVVWGRLMLSRPESVLFISLMLGYIAPNRWVWAAVMVPLVPLYWMAPIYSAGAVLLRAKTIDDVVKNMATAAAYVVVALAFWFWYTQGQYLDLLWVMSQALEFSRNKVSELQGNVAGLSNPKVLMVWVVFVLACVFHAWRQHSAPASPEKHPDANWDLKRPVAACFFVATVLALPDMVRYMPYICLMLSLATCLLVRSWVVGPDFRSLWAEPGFPSAKTSLSHTRPDRYLPSSLADIPAPFGLGGHSLLGDVQGRLGPRHYRVFAALCVGVVAGVVQVPPSRDKLDRPLLEVFKVEEGARVLSQFNSAAYVMTASNPKSLVTPVYEMGAVTQPELQVMADFSLGKWPSCAVITQYDYVFENNVGAVAPECVSFVQKAKEYTLWRVWRAPAANNLAIPKM